MLQSANAFKSHYNVNEPTHTTRPNELKQKNTQVAQTNTDCCRQVLGFAAPVRRVCTIPAHERPAHQSHFRSSPNVSRPSIRWMPSQAANFSTPPMAACTTKCSNAWGLASWWRIACMTVVFLCPFWCWTNCARHSSGPNGWNSHAIMLQITAIGNEEREKIRCELLVFDYANADDELCGLIAGRCEADQQLTFSRNVSVDDKSKYSRTFGWARKLYKFCVDGQKNRIGLKIWDCGGKNRIGLKMSVVWWRWVFVMIGWVFIMTDWCPCFFSKFVHLHWCHLWDCCRLDPNMLAMLKYSGSVSMNGPFG